MSSPRPVHAIAWFEGQFGYNTHTRGFFEALAASRPVAASPLVGLKGPWAEDQRLVTNVFGSRAISIALLNGSLSGFLQAAPGPKIIYTVWESTRLPDDWRQPMAGADRVWVPSTWGRQVMIDDGVPAKRIDVVPEGVDPEMFCPEGPRTDAFDNKTGFKFLNIGRYEDRKGTRMLIEAFDAEFGANEPVCLLLSCHNAHDKDYDPGAVLRAIKPRHPNKLVFIPPLKSFHHMATIYRACDAFVSPFRAEGWGLPLLEAMACGLPVIATGYSAPTDFLGAEAWRIGHRVVPIETPYFKRDDGDYGQWALPDRDHLRALMREVYENPAAAQRRALVGSERVRRDFSWQRAAATANHLLEQL